MIRGQPVVSFQSRQKKRLAAYALERYGVQGHLLPYKLIAETLHASYRERTLGYFAKHKIKWWTSRWDVGRPPLGPDDVGAPTGHLNSSQVAAVNHLEPARLDVDVARNVLANVDRTLVEPVPVEDGGFVAYEWIGAQNYLSEPGARTRGAQVTSLDALKSARDTDRVAIYRPLLDRSDCPIAVDNANDLFFDPYEQLMRQALLAWQMVEHNEFGATDWIHVHVVPEENVALRGRSGAAPKLSGDTMAEAWQSVLKEPERYQLMTATELLSGAPTAGWDDWRDWLHDRYET
jgi:restriction endonuclease-like protein